jgi:hypothetical protein
MPPLNSEAGTCYHSISEVLSPKKCFKRRLDNLLFCEPWKKKENTINASMFCSINEPLIDDEGGKRGETKSVKITRNIVHA